MMEGDRMDPSGRLAGKVALITGAAGGQGAAEAEMFVAAGAKVVLTDVQDDLGRDMAALLGRDATFRHLDVRREADWLRAVADTEAMWGPISVLINNAGIAAMTPLLTTSEEEYRRVFDVNELGVFLGMKTIGWSMRRGGGGSIVNISSVDGIVAQALLGPYVASKFAVRGLTKVGALEFGELNIRVNSIHPGWIDTPMVRRDAAEPPREALEHIAATQPIARIGRPQEVAALALFLASDESSFCTGGEYLVDGGVLAGEWPPRSRKLFREMLDGSS
jgi:3alpha(or 20beta)-hydroxysteroid dehydrogenase